MATLAEAAVEIIAELDSFEPDLRRKLTKAVQSAADDAEKEFRKSGTRSGKVFSDAVGQAAASNTGSLDKIKASIAGLETSAKRAGDAQIDSAEKVRRAEVALAKTKRETSLVTIDGSEKIIAAEARVAKARRDSARADGVALAATTALGDARTKLATEGTAAGEVFAQNLRKVVTKESTKTGNDSGDFFTRAFQTAAARSIGSTLVKTFAALGATLTASVGPLGTIVGGASAAVVALAAAIGQASGAAVAFGGVLGALGLAAATVKIGLSGVGDAITAQSKALAELAATGKVSDATQKALDATLKNLAPNARAVVLQLAAMAPAWRAVQQVVQNNLFAGVSKSLADLGARFLPILKAQLGTAATTLSSFATGFASFLTAGPQAAQINSILTGLNGILRSLLSGVKPLVSGFLTLFQASLPFAKQLADVLGGFGAKFKAFAEGAVKSGSFKTFMEGAFKAASDLLGILGNVGKIIGTVFSAGAANGESLLGVIQELTGDLATFLASAQGKATLASFFGLISDAGGILKNVFTTLKPVIDGVKAVFDALGPALTNLGTALQPVILAFTTLVGSTLTRLAPVFAALVAAVTPLVAVLGQALVTVLGAVLNAIIPILPTIVEFAAALAVQLIPVVIALVPVITQIAVAFGQFLLAVAPLIPQLIPLIPSLAQIAISFVQVLAALVPLLPLFVQLAQDTVPQIVAGLQVVIPFIIALAENMANVVGVVTRVIAALVGFITKAVGIFLQFKQAGATTFEAFAATVGTLIAGLVTKVIAFFTKMVTGSLAVVKGWATSAILAAKRVANGILDAITSGLEKLAGNLKTAGRNAVQGFVDGLGTGLQKVRDIAGQIASAVSGPVAKFLKMGSPSKVMHALGGDTIQGYINGIAEKIPALRAALGQLARAVPGQVKTAIGQVNTALGSLGSALTSTTKLRLNTLISAAKTSIGILTTAQAALDARSKAAQDNLKSLLDQSRQFTSQVFSNIVQGGNITTGQDQSFAGIVARLTQARDAAVKFQQVLAQLSKSGLSKTALQQIAEAGPEAGLAAGQAVLAAGKSGIAQINKLQAQLQAAALKAATTAANALFGQGIKVAEGIVAGLARQKKALDAQMTRLGDVLVARIISALRSAGVRGLSIPGFANGGLITRPTLATFAEKGPEVAIPLNKPARRDQLLDRYFGGWADQRAFGNGGTGYGGPTSSSSKTLHMPITVQGLSKDETTQVLHQVLDRRIGSHIGITTSGGDL